MKLGLCKCCGCKLGRKTANGAFFYDKKLVRQILMKYRVNDKPSYSEVVVVICKDCLEEPDIDILETELKKDPSFKDFKKEFPDAEYVSFKKDTLPWD